MNQEAFLNRLRHASCTNPAKWKDDLKAFLSLTVSVPVKHRSDFQFLLFPDRA